MHLYLFSRWFNPKNFTIIVHIYIIQEFYKAWPEENVHTEQFSIENANLFRKFLLN